MNGHAHHHPPPAREHAPPSAALDAARCGCGEECLGCKAGVLAVTAGATVEAKQHEYALAERVAEHDPHGHGADPASEGGHDHAAMMADPRFAARMERDMRDRFLVALALTVPVALLSPLGAALLPAPLLEGPAVNWLLLALTTPVVFWAGWPFLSGAWRALRRRTLDMSVLIATGVLVSYVFSVALTLAEPGGETFYDAGAMLVTFVLFGHWMEMKSRRGTSESLRALLDLVPPRARVVRDGREVEVATSEVRVGDVVALRPGDKAPVDGEVVEGESAVDESLVTGESLPVPKKPGSRVVGGSINTTGALRFRATKVGSDTALAGIVKLVEDAQSSKAPGQRIADRWAQVLVLVAVGSGLLTFAVWSLVARQDLLTSLTFAVSAVVIACPDALGLATPTAVAVGTGVGARENVLIKDAATLEGVSRVTAVAFDKTGTLTEGKPRVTDVVARGVAEADVLRLAAGLEARSGHPLAKAILDEAARRGVATPARIEEFESLSGLGLAGRVEGRDVLVGTSRLLEERKVDLAPVLDEAQRLLGEGKTLSLVAVDGVAVGLLAARDPVRASARRTVDALHAMGIRVAMITGDNRATAEAVARELGVDAVFAEVLPQDKSDHVKRLQREGHVVAMVGDGVNDAPALAQADVGIAIGAGTDVAVETASVVLMRSDPADVLKAIRLSRATVRKMRQNLAWASVYNVAAIPVAAGVLFPAFGIMLAPAWSALLMSLSSVIVATNAVSLRREQGRLAA